MEEKTVYELLGEKVHAEFEAYRKRFIAYVKNDMFHDMECGVFAIKADLEEFFYEDDVESRISEEQAKELLEVEDLLDVLTEHCMDYERDWQEPIHFAIDRTIEEKE